MAQFRGLQGFLLFLAFWIVQANTVFDPQTPVKVTVKFQKEPQDVIVPRGGSAVLDCLADSEMQANVSWKHASLVIVPDPRRYILVNGSLMFEKVLHKRSGRPNTGPGPGGGNGGSDEGEYTCLLTTSAGTIMSRTAHLRVASLAREFSEIPLNQSAAVGDSVRFSCQIESWPAASLSWEKDGKLLDLDIDRYEILEPGVLLLKQVKLEDAGNYRCLANNSLASRSRRSPAGRLTVEPSNGGKMRFVSPPSEGKTYVQLGGSTVLECAVTGGKEPAVNWTLNGLPFEKQVDGRNSTAVSPLVVEFRPTHLKLSNLSRNDSGEYGCNVTSASSAEFMIKTWRVVVMEPPILLQTPKSAYYPTAKTARLECEAAGTPKPDIRWVKDGKPVIIGGRIKQRTKSGSSTSELVLSNSITSDSGLYQCIAESRAGYASASARVVVNASQGRPDPPSGLAATTISSTEVLLSWDNPKNVPADEIKAFTVHWMPSEGGDELQDVSTNTTFKVGKLKPYTNYTFYVRAYSRKSASDQSDPVTVTTGEDVPVATPEVTLEPINPTTLRVTWQRLPTHLLRGSPTHYRIEYRRHKQLKSDMYVVKPDVQEYVMTGLHPGKKYDVRVLPGNKKGIQQDRNRDWPWYTAEMPRIGGEAGLIAPNLYLICTSHLAIQALWGVPVPGSRLPRGFRLSYKPVATGELFVDVEIPLNQTSVLIDSLDSGTLYEIKLTLYGDDPMTGPYTSRFIRTLSRVLLDNERAATQGIQAPVGLEAEATSSQSLKASWVPADLNVTYYTVRWQNTEVPGDVGYLRSTNEGVNITDLLPFTNYAVAVQLSTADKKDSYWSQPVEIKTKTDVPSAPRNLTWTVSEKTVLLGWSSPERPNGVLLGFTVFFTLDPSLPPEKWISEEILPIKVKAKLSGIQPELEYTVRMSAKTSAGSGPLSDPITIKFSLSTLDSSGNLTGNGTSVAAPVIITEQQIGIILGLSVLFLAVVLCTIVLLWRFRCTKQARQDRNVPASGYPGNTNAAARAAGNGHIYLTTTMNGNLVTKIHASERSRESASQDGGNSIDMDVFTPMLATLPPDTSVHIDTKGGYSSLQRSSQSGSLQRPPSSRATDHASSDEGISVMAEVSDNIWTQRIGHEKETKLFLANRMEEWADVTAVTSLDLSTLVEEPCPSCTDKLSPSVSSFVSPTRSTYSSTLGATSPLLSSTNTPCTPTGEVWSARIIATPVKVGQPDSSLVCVSEISSHSVD